MIWAFDRQGWHLTAVLCTALGCQALIAHESTAPLNPPRRLSTTGATSPAVVLNSSGNTTIAVQLTTSSRNSGSGAEMLDLPPSLAVISPMISVGLKKEGSESGQERGMMGTGKRAAGGGTHTSVLICNQGGGMVQNVY